MLVAAVAVLVFLAFMIFYCALIEPLVIDYLTYWVNRCAHWIQRLRSKR